MTEEIDPAVPAIYRACARLILAEMRIWQAKGLPLGPDLPKVNPDSDKNTR